MNINDFNEGEEDNEDEEEEIKEEQNWARLMYNIYFYFICSFAGVFFFWFFYNDK